MICVIWLCGCRIFIMVNFVFCGGRRKTSRVDVLEGCRAIGHLDFPKGVSLIFHWLDSLSMSSKTVGVKGPVHWEHLCLVWLGGSAVCWTLLEAGLQIWVCLDPCGILPVPKAAQPAWAVGGWIGEPQNPCVSMNLGPPRPSLSAELGLPRPL